MARLKKKSSGGLPPPPVDEGRAVLAVVQQYTRAWRLLLEYDEERLAEAPARPVAPDKPLTLDEARI